MSPRAQYNCTGGAPYRAARIHVPARAVQLLVQILGAGNLAGQAGDHEARVGPLGQPFRLGHHPAHAAPRLAQGLTDALDQAFVAHQPQDIVHRVAFAPVHYLVVAKARVAPHHDPHRREALPDPPDDPLQLLNAARGRVDVRRAQPRAQQVFAAEDIQRLVAMALVVAVEEPPLLGAVQRIVRGVQVQPHRLRRPPVRLQKQLHQQPVQRQPVHPLRHQLLHAVFDPPALAPVGETRRDPARQIQPTVRLPQQKGSAVARQMPGVESRHHLAATKGMKWKLCRDTLYRHGISPSV